MAELVPVKRKNVGPKKWAMLPEDLVKGKFYWYYGAGDVTDCVFRIDSFNGDLVSVTWYDQPDSQPYPGEWKNSFTNEEKVHYCSDEEAVLYCLTNGIHGG